MKDVIFVDTSLENLRAFPQTARQRAGFQIDAVQRGKDPSDWRPMHTIGAGVREIRIHADGAFRVIYVAKFEEAAYVLHCFQKKTQKTRQADLDLARAPYQAMMKMRNT